ncbi:MBL fold metallo-hydrolase [Alkalihalobacillus sp. AL-G]|uniref:MBL fold metallo-hydrolase n=1 Tax=Alkalihalobacillus sp. AL-G TaxID=2926399 RepID=UPI00272DC2F4|nr:MBL fold metallo-hydrolase [Alkalihalobacillus sp. AL-G]WLD94969.1 MBL fold metallo-hydrolase [Alkalihalobacillus sp. AL-G]
MEFIQINHNCYYFNGPVNIGYVNVGDHGLLIDTGIDQQAMKRIIRMLDDRSLPITHLFITHAHADHYGGANYLQKKKRIYTIAPAVEESILQNPIIEPIYLSQGNRPLIDMRNKFLEGSPVRVDHIVSEGMMKLGQFELDLIALPGHSINQLGVKVGNILYAADSYFSEEQLNKHRIPFIIDANATLATLEKLLSMGVEGSIPGHGVYEVEVDKTIITNYDHHVSIIESMYRILSNYPDGCSFETIMSEMCRKWNVHLPSVSVWSLYRTAIFSYLIKGIEDKKIEMTVKDFNLYFIPTDE